MVCPRSTANNTANATSSPRVRCPDETGPARRNFASKSGVAKSAEKSGLERRSFEQSTRHQIAVFCVTYGRFYQRFPKKSSKSRPLVRDVLSILTPVQVERIQKPEG